MQSNAPDQELRDSFYISGIVFPQNLGIAKELIPQSPQIISPDTVPLTHVHDLS